MRIATIVRVRLRTLLKRATVDREFDEELRYHAERQTEAYTAAGGLGAVALAASFVPARRAASIQPVEALRTE